MAHSGRHVCRRYAKLPPISAPTSEGFVEPVFTMTIGDWFSFYDSEVADLSTKSLFSSSSTDQDVYDMLDTNLGNTEPRSKTPYGHGRESKRNNPHRLDNYDYKNGISYKTISSIFGSKMPKGSEILTRFIHFVSGMRVDRACKRRIPNMYGWIDENWDVIGMDAVRYLTGLKARGGEINSAV